MKQTVVTFCLMFLSLFVGAQEVVKIGGVVRNESGNPIELAVVRLESTAIGTATNLKGRYSLKFEPRDSVTVVCSMLGYQTRKKLLLNPRGNISLNFTLSPLDFELGEVSITVGDRREAHSNWMPLPAR